MPLLLLVLTAASPGVPGLGRAAYAETVKWVGCDISKASYIDAVAKAFATKTGHSVEVRDAGATRGIRDVVAGHAHMGGSCRSALNIPEERGVKLIPAAWDALVAIVHPSNSVSDITREQIRGVLMGHISNWKTLGGPDRPILVFERPGTISGVGVGTRLLLFGNLTQKFTPNAKIFPSTGPLEQALEETPDAFAMSGISSARLGRLKMLKIEGRSPTRDNVIKGEYLLYRPLYLTVPEHPGPVVSQFIKFLFSNEGQAIVQSTGTVTLAEGKHLWEKFKDQMR